MAAAERASFRTCLLGRRDLLKAAALAAVGLAAQACTGDPGSQPTTAPTATSPSPSTLTALPEPTATLAPTTTATPGVTVAPEPTATAAPEPTAKLEQTAAVVGSATVDPTATAPSQPTTPPEPTLEPELAAEILRPIGKDYSLPLDFEPSELHTLTEYLFVKVTPGKEYMQGHPEAAKWVSRLFRAATEDGIEDMVIGSAYRSIDTQTTLWERAGGENQDWVAPPGTSEHHSGLAFDFTTASIDYRIDNEAGFEDTPAGRWLFENAHRFGFVNTYARPGIDGVPPEPWHYRYATVPISTQLFEMGYLQPDSTINPIEFYASLLGNPAP